MRDPGEGAPGDHRRGRGGPVRRLSATARTLIPLELGEQARLLGFLAQWIVLGVSMV